MVASDRLTVPEKLLLAALNARERGRTFTAEDLVVAAWQLFPDTFGLAGYSDKFPDSNRILTNIMGTKGMRGKGWLRKVGEKQYQLTGKGLSDADGLSQRAESPDVPRALRAELERRTAASLLRLLSTSAAKKALAGDGSDVTFNEACGFWDITSRTNASTLNANLSERAVLLSRALEATRAASGGALQLSSCTVSAGEIKDLLTLNEIMQQKFKAELDIIRKRIDERLEPRRRPDLPQ